MCCFLQKTKKGEKRKNPFFCLLLWFLVKTPHQNGDDDQTEQEEKSHDHPLPHHRYVEHGAETVS